MTRADTEEEDCSNARKTNLPQMQLFLHKLCFAEPLCFRSHRPNEIHHPLSGQLVGKPDHKLPGLPTLAGDPDPPNISKGPSAYRLNASGWRDNQKQRQRQGIVVRIRALFRKAEPGQSRLWIFNEVVLEALSWLNPLDQARSRNIKVETISDVSLLPNVPFAARSRSSPGNSVYKSRVERTRRDVGRILPGPLNTLSLVCPLRLIEDEAKR